MKSLIVPATEDAIDEVQAFINDELVRCGCSEDVQGQIEIVVEEIFVNIASYAYHPVEGEAEIRCEVQEDPLQVTIQFLDHGHPFDPLAKEDADTSVEAIEAREGGLGILLVKKMMDDVQYSYQDGKNVLTVKKRLVTE